MCMKGDFTIRRIPRDKAIIGVRRWTNWECFKLEPVYATHILRHYTPGPMKAHQAPGRRASKDAGFHAYKRWPSHWYRRDEQDGYVYGRVRLWGRVAEHPDGYRAEFCEIESLRKPSGAASLRLQVLIGDIAKDYGVRVR